MHLVLLTRGAPEQVDIWKKFMETQMFDWKRRPLLRDDKGNFIKKEDGTYERGPDVFTRVQGALRPIQFYEYVFPEECLPEVLAMMNIHKAESLKLRPEVATPAWFIRKIMKLKPVPVIPELQGEETYQLTNKWVPTTTVATYPIGIRSDFKKDFIFNMGDGTQQGFYQEGL